MYPTIRATWLGPFGWEQEDFELDEFSRRRASLESSDCYQFRLIGGLV
jgi:hypothetical protein